MLGTAITAYVGAGSNIAPRKNIPKALRLLSREVTVVEVSTFFESPALERPEQPPFLNGVVAVLTVLPARALKYEVLRVVETAVGRERGEDKYAARPIDLDILVYGDRVVDEDGLRIPDPDIEKRPFIAVPLLELAPDMLLPDSNARLAELDAANDLTTIKPDSAFTESLRSMLEL
jgi:dihydroneopterin aldolase/2-amino-4-hydroxy-6-hydroxymethyldihydropteridine diphosphokinase